MGKLIDADVLKQHIDKLPALPDGNFAGSHSALKALINMQPTVQPEIIRCKDCENWDTTWQNDSAPNYHYCPMMDGTYSGDFYCGKSERRTDG